MDKEKDRNGVKGAECEEQRERDDNGTNREVAGRRNLETAVNEVMCRLLSEQPKFHE